MRTITFKVTEDEARRLRQQARMARLTLSEYLRRRVGHDAGPRRAVGFQRCPLTGAKIFAPAPQYVPLSTETVKDMLSEFP